MRAALNQRVCVKVVVCEKCMRFALAQSRLLIFGESAGAGSVAAHLVAPRSRGLFTRAAMESGAPKLPRARFFPSFPVLARARALEAGGASDSSQFPSAYSSLGAGSVRMHVLTWPRCAPCNWDLNIVLSVLSLPPLPPMVCIQPRSACWDFLRLAVDYSISA